ncbi:hypothetical protein [Streptomyces varsoviensis]|uniref:Gram-positive cocci surface proteins LPxTG domain-containing protein n=1 Tax=Streptomyces varsoviensis TaxID=67373 RepID=A0ABR5J2Q2_9ACTN|nr:hypothetical protein [Streptomyces varsoviensis]KOG87644.1 hypothetical protein ADK38_24275 [Streptomyces varsoviensis]
MTARRPLLTAAAAGSLLCALWFVPSAKATAEHTTPTQHSHRSATTVPASDSDSKRPLDTAQSAQSAQSTSKTSLDAARPASMEQASDELALADTGSVDTTPYLVGGIGFLGLGGALVTTAVRRTRASDGY